MQMWLEPIRNAFHPLRPIILELKRLGVFEGGDQIMWAFNGENVVLSNILARLQLVTFLTWRDTSHC